MPQVLVLVRHRSRGTPQKGFRCFSLQLQRQRNVRDFTCSSPLLSCLIVVVICLFLISFGILLLLSVYVQTFYNAHLFILPLSLVCFDDPLRYVSWQYSVMLSALFVVFVILLASTAVFRFLFCQPWRNTTKSGSCCARWHNLYPGLRVCCHLSNQG